MTLSLARILEILQGDLGEVVAATGRADVSLDLIDLSTADGLVVRRDGLLAIGDILVSSPR